MNRRLFLGSLAGAAGLGAAESFRQAPPLVDAEGGRPVLQRVWSGDRCHSTLTNKGTDPARVREVVLFSWRHSLPADTALYAESFQMLSQTGGSLGQPADLGYSESKHYRIPQPADASAVATGLLTLTPPRTGTTHLFAFSSCRRFSGRFYLRPGVIDFVLDTEGLALDPGERWDLEELIVAQGPSRTKLLASLADAINRNHPPLIPKAFPAPPTGWCSWYCFGPKVTAENVRENLAVIARDIPALKYVQIDDGYQPAMGDWLDTGKAFGGNVQGVLKEIRDRGFQPAIWVAPFIAGPDSKLFREHADWFMKGADGQPLPSNKVTFGGWRLGPWYALDGTHPGARKHLESVFRTMRQEWGVTYFKLDANFWGAMHSARLHDPKATRIEAYRRGMEAVRAGAGEDSFLLGCNHPIWASFGLIHGSRSSADISRRWNVFTQIARQNLNRNWQNGRLWWNDPDAIVLTGSLPLEEYRFHATMGYASGGMILSGDDLAHIPPDRLRMLKSLLPAHGKAAEFDGPDLRLGTTRLNASTTAYSLLNWSDRPETFVVEFEGTRRVTELWTGENFGERTGRLEIRDLPARGGRVLIASS